ncbi:hypothetical protein C4553_01375 [Candidatus Parcubacteria bacterium]|nr:MAG: hypothetical protein C4553_01375 [Candidatus Parcubacteria bacterium]
MDLQQQSSFPNLKGAKDLLSESLLRYKGYWRIILLSGAVPSLLYLPVTFGSFGKIPFLIFSLLGVIFLLLFRLALIELAVSQDSSTPSFGFIWKEGLKRFFPIIWISTITAFAVFGGFFLFVIPAIFLAIILSLGSYILFAEKASPIISLARSWHYVRGYWWGIVLRYVYFGIIVVLIALAVGFLAGLGFSASRDAFSMKFFIGEKGSNPIFEYINLLLNNFIFAPLSTLYVVGIYRSLKNSKAPPTMDEEIIYKKKIAAFVIVGGIAVLLLVVFAGVVIKALFFAEPLLPFNDLRPVNQVFPSVNSTALGLMPLFEFLKLFP